MQIILASASQRRKKLLRKIIPRFKVIKPRINESSIKKKKLSPGKYACVLASAKAFKVASKLKNKIVIGADTIVHTKQNQLIGKPNTKKNALKILRKLSGTTHSVITGVTVINTSNWKTASSSEKTIIRMKKLSPALINSISKSPKHYDKAGGYAIQENKDKNLKIIKGKLDNAVGLPLKLTKKLIKQVC